jgi:hypothetical protein
VIGSTGWITGTSYKPRKLRPMPCHAADSDPMPTGMAAGLKAGPIGGAVSPRPALLSAGIAVTVRWIVEPRESNEQSCPSPCFPFARARH